MAKKQKVIKVPANKLTIEAVNNGYRVTVGNLNEGRVLNFNVGDGSLGWVSVGNGSSTFENVTGEYVFPDFVSLTRWMRDNLKHGKPAKAA